MRSLITSQIKKAISCEIYEFDNPDDGYAFAMETPPDILVLDYQFTHSDLRFRNGIDFLKSLAKTNSFPIIALSGQKDKEIMADMFRHGVIDYIGKDEERFIEKLINSIQEVLVYRKTKQLLKSTIWGANPQIFIGMVILFFGLLSLSLWI